MRALVIDDSRVVRTIIGSILRELGMDVLEAANGVEAVDRMKHNQDIELVLVDWNMPVMDGLEFIQIIRSQRSYDGVRIMMVTTETDSEQVTRALNAGANEYVMKPFTKEILLAKISMLNLYEE